MKKLRRSDMAREQARDIGLGTYTWGAARLTRVHQEIELRRLLARRTSVRDETLEAAIEAARM
jgi:hypothetical protein